MHIYNIGYWSYEESYYEQLSHEKRYSKEELNKIFKQVLLVCFRKHLESNPPYPKDTTLQTLMHLDEFLEEFKKRGFKPIKCSESINVFGWAPILEGGFKCVVSDKEKEIKEYLKNNCSDILDIS